jgi:HD-like signal output (HDOD) protein
MHAALPTDKDMTNTATRSEEAISPLETVVRRLDVSTGFPALSTTIADINRIAASDSESVSKLTRTILRDVSLTRKLLHVVNSATYGQFGGRIHTVSKAVLILGFEAVRNAAMSLVLLEFSKGHAQAKTMQDEIVSAYFAGVVSKSICERLEIRNNEEAVICTMFQNLGKLLATFFLYEESLQVRELIATGMTEDQAAIQVLGISYHELGIGMAKQWNFPDRLVQGQ